MEPDIPAPLAGAEFHGFHTTADLNVANLMDEASTRWFRPNELHAILSNHTLFKIQPQPVDTPKSGRVLLFDRKILRNFRKDGHNWKKKRDGKTVQEAHEKLKIGNEDRIHVYYARNEDDPSFCRRCYWLLDKDLEHIVLVHYRRTSEENEIQQVPVSVACTEALSLTDARHHGSPVTPVNSASGSAHSEMSASAVHAEEINSLDDYDTSTGSGKYPVKNCNELETYYESCLNEINTLDWADLVEEPTSVNFSQSTEGDVSSSGQQIQCGLSCMNNDRFLPANGMVGEKPSSGHPSGVNMDNDLDGVKQANDGYSYRMEDQQIPSMLPKTLTPSLKATNFNLNPSVNNGNKDTFAGDLFLNQNYYEQLNYNNDDSLGTFDGLQLETSIMNVDKSSTQNQIFSITDISPAWAYSTEETKVIIVGHFRESHKHFVGSNIFCVFGGICVATEMVQVGVYRCMALPHAPGLVNLYLTLDGNAPISQVLSFDYRSRPSVWMSDGMASTEVDNLKWENCQAQIRLAHLLFSTTNNISILSRRVTSNNLREAKKFALLTSPLMKKDWISLLKLAGNDNPPFTPSGQLFELVLRNKLQECLLTKIAEGCKTIPHDSQGQGVIHLCAVLDYTWAVRLFSLSGMSLDFRDAFGWTALHWAAYCGRQKMVAALLSAGANPSLVTDPTTETPGGCTAADLASQRGYEGLAAYLAEKGLAAHFEAMSLSGNISGPMPPRSTDPAKSENLYSQNLSEQELLLKESLAAYRNAADAAGRIQAAFRERYLKLQTREVQLVKPEVEASNIVAALKIQYAFRSYSRRKMMKAAGQIQGHFRTWKARKDFLNMRRQAIRIQAAFRGHLVRKQYQKIIWSVGVLEKAVLRWRLKRKGLRGIQTGQMETMGVDTEQENTVEEDFYQISREQAEERIKRSVVRVQAMFRSYRAQQEYQRMKQAHEQAKLEFDDLINPTQLE